MRSSILCALLAAATTSALACDAMIQANGQATPAEGKSPEVAADAQADVKIEADDVDLESIGYLVKKGKVKDAQALEKAINDPKEKLHSVDIDGDGKLDTIQIVEVKKPNDEIVFELHVIPSSKLKVKDKGPDVVVAYLDFAPNKESGQMVVKATFAPIVVGHETIVYDYTVSIVVKGDVVVVESGPAFYGWLFAVRPVYVGVIVVDVEPPVVIKHKHKHVHEHKHDHKHHKHKGKGHWHWH